MRWIPLRTWLACVAMLTALSGRAAQAELKDLTLQGGVTDGKARLVIEALLRGMGDDREKAFYSTALQHSMRLTGERIEHTITATFETLQGDPKELVLAVKGEGEILSVGGEAIQDWSVRRETGGAQWLILRTRKMEKPPSQWTASITATTRFKALPETVKPLALVAWVPALGSGYLKIESAPDLMTETAATEGLIPIEVSLLPEAMRKESGQAGALAFRFQGGAYAMSLRCGWADPELRSVALRDYRLEGRLADGVASFVLHATARARDPRGGVVRILSGGAALSEAQEEGEGRLEFEDGAYRMRFQHAGDFPVRLRFNAMVRRSNDWQSVEFKLAPGSLQPVVLSGLAADSELRMEGSARPVRKDDAFHSFLPADGTVRFAWKRARPEVENRLFFSAEMLAQAVLAQGVSKQVEVLDFKVMQGEINRVTLRVSGTGDITRVQGANILSWQAIPTDASGERKLVVQFNQPQRDTFTLQIQSQTDLGAFPTQTDLMKIVPEGATRFAGHIRVVNEGAVRLEILGSRGLSQVSPEQFPEPESLKSLFAHSGSQRFAFRCSTADFSLRMQADGILPELGISQLLAYHLGENEVSIDAEFDIDVREAPVRELALRIPRGFSVSKVTAAGMSDYVPGESAGEPELRILYAKPAQGRQLVQLRLERNSALGTNLWQLPRVEVVRAKAMRGSIVISSDLGYRLSAERTQGLVEIATAFAPKKVAGIQAAFRVTDQAWQAAMRVERVPQTIQAEAFHLFSIGEGIAYGSSTLNYSISGAPKGMFQVELSDEYSNVEFTGKDIRSWQKNARGYLVQLHTPVSIAFTLLATYERPFKAGGDTLAFTGARPMEVQSEQGHTIVVSAYQFQVKPANVSPGLASLETAEVPSEYRFFFDAPILAAYRYTARPFELRLALSPLAQGDSLSMVVDRASLTTRISKDGEVITDARYFLKNRGNSHLRIETPQGAELWSATVDGATVSPIKDGTASLIPLPQKSDPNSVQTLELKLASRSANPHSIGLAAPVLTCPVLLAEWNVEADAGQRLVYRRGSLIPAGGVPDTSAFATLGRAMQGGGARLFQAAWIGFGLILVARFAWRWAGGEGAYRFSPRHVLGAVLGSIAFALALISVLFAASITARHRVPDPRQMVFVAPVQQGHSALRIEVQNLAAGLRASEVVSAAWPAAAAIAFGLFALKTAPRPMRRFSQALVWTLLAWAALRWPGAAELFFGLIALYLSIGVAAPAWFHLARVPRKPISTPLTGAGPAVALLALGLFMPGNTASAQMQTAVAQSVLQEVTVEGRHAQAAAVFRWHATQGQSLPLLVEPAILTAAEYPTNALKWVLDRSGSNSVHRVWALKDGIVEIKCWYQIETTTRDGDTGFFSPIPHGLVNRWDVTVKELDVEISSPQSVSSEHSPKGADSRARLVTLPSDRARIAWKPRSRDVRREKAQFFAELSHLFAPAAGVVEGVHSVQIRPAQGELSELVLEVPEGVTIADVTESQLRTSEPPARSRQATPPQVVASWRFAPDTRMLRVNFGAPQSRPFQFLVRSQMAASPLPFEKRAGLLGVRGAEGQLGWVGVATVAEVQLDRADAGGMAPINLEDFPSAVVSILAGQQPGLVLRRAFRVSGSDGSILLRASAVEPDVRVESAQTFSLGEDRVVLAANLAVAITRSGVFRLSFMLPSGLEVESLTSAAMSHWTELAQSGGRLITMHLNGKTTGEIRFAVALVGAGLKSVKQWNVPRLELREASKQRGQLLLVPEQGIRLQVGARDGVAQLDPQKSGIQQKGVLSFRMLQEKWSLTLDLEQVDAWVQTTSLQHLVIGPAQAKTWVNLQYQIENTGLKSFKVRIPTNAESVRFKGDQVADFLPVAGAVDAGFQVWEVKMHRRVLGKYLLQATYQTTVQDPGGAFLVQGVQAMDAGLQRGFLSIEGSGRLQIKPGALPAALQASEWQSVPRNLRQDVTSASHTFRLVDATYQLPLLIERHEAAKLLPARVTSVTLRSVISDEGVMLTEARLELVPGDKRLLQLTLPKDSRFWFAFVNQNGVWPWKENDRTLIPLESSRVGKPAVVELYYSSKIGSPGSSSLDLALHGPQFDLPLENITWNVLLNPKWRLKSWSGTLQLQEERYASDARLDVQTYLQQEASLKQEKSKAAEDLLFLGNSLIEQGDPQQARKAFQSAFGLSRHDEAFNEDARVQLHNLKLQQAVVGLNVFNNRLQAGTADTAAAKPPVPAPNASGAYTQADAKRLMDSNTAEENSAMTRLADRLIQQQDAALPTPSAIRASVPQQGKQWTFARTVQVDTFADLSLKLKAEAATPASSGKRFLWLGALLVFFTALWWKSSPGRVQG